MLTTIKSRRWRRYHKLKELGKRLSLFFSCGEQGQEAGAGAVLNSVSLLPGPAVCTCPLPPSPHFPKREARYASCILLYVASKLLWF